MSRESPPQDSQTGAAVRWGYDIVRRDSDDFLPPSNAGAKHTSS